MSKADRIPIPWTHKWRRFRQSVLPILSFCACLVFTLWLWNRQGRMPNAVGEVETVRREITAASAGTLVELGSGRRWDLFDPVDKNEVVARLDDGPTRAALTTLGKELESLKKDLEATRLRVEQKQTDRETRLVLEVQRHRLEAVRMQAQIEGDRMELSRLDVLLAVRRQVKKGVVADQELAESRSLRDEVDQRVRRNVDILNEIKEQGRQTLELLARCRGEKPAEKDGASPRTQETDLDKMLQPLRASIDAKNAEMDQLKLQIQNLQIKAPIKGRICAIHRFPGENVQPGDPILAIAAGANGYILSYVRQQQRFHPHKGMQVQLRTRESGSRSVVAEVEWVGSQYELVPPHQCTDPKTPEWGLPVRIPLPAKGLNARPGELIDITFSPWERTRKKTG